MKDEIKIKFKIAEILAREEKTLLDSSNKLTAIYNYFNINHNKQLRESLISLIKYYEDAPLTIGLEEPEFLVDKFLDSINKK